MAFIRPPASACVIFNETHHILYTPYSEQEEEIVDDTVTLWPNTDLNESITTTTTEATARILAEVKDFHTLVKRGKQWIFVWNKNLMWIFVRWWWRCSAQVGNQTSATAHSCGGQISPDSRVHTELQPWEACVLSVATILHNRLQIGRCQRSVLLALSPSAVGRIFQCTRYHTGRQCHTQLSW